MDFTAETLDPLMVIRIHQATRSQKLLPDGVARLAGGRYPCTTCGR